MDMKWYGRACGRQIKARVGSNLPSFCDVILDAARDKISVPGPDPSEPGEPPHMQSERLRDSLYSEIDASNLRARMGSTEEHAAYTEFGTALVRLDHAGMAARPWFVPSILEDLDDASRKLVQ